MSNYPPLKRAETEFSALSSSPLRHGSTTSTASTVYSIGSSFAPSRTSTLSSNGSIDHWSSHQRGKSELVNTMSTVTERRGSTPNIQTPSAAETYGTIRRSLRPLPQVPSASPPANKTKAPRHTRSQTVDAAIYEKPVSSYPTRPFTPPPKENAEPTTPKHTDYPGSPSSPRHRPFSSTTQSSPHPPTLTTALTAPELETFQKSSTGHLRNLSKFARNGDTEEFSIGGSAPSVTGLHGRRRLKRSDSVRDENGVVRHRKKHTSAWAEGNWMDKQRQFLQAYEYLCHIGEAKEWIEDVIQKPIAPIVELEEALRDGVTLAELVQAIHPDRPVRIFRHPRLQFRHSDNIAQFFRLLQDVELPDLFRFELIDLYEKKNIPKVIHCIHALSWLLFKQGIIAFRIGNLVGQLEFEHHELEQVQKGLDKSGVSMPSFSGMGASFGAEPEPEPEETEEERIDRDLHENEVSVKELQCQVRGALLRLQLGNLMSGLWDAEGFLIDLQSRIRGDWTRQIVEYRLSMRRFAINLQAAARGFLLRSKQRSSEEWQKQTEPQILQLQSIIRGCKARARVSVLDIRLRREEPGIKTIQAAIRGALKRSEAYNQYEATRDAEAQVQDLQAAIRGMLVRRIVENDQQSLLRKQPSFVSVQAAIRGMLARKTADNDQQSLLRKESSFVTVQAAIRAMITRMDVKEIHQSLLCEEPSLITIQSAARALAARQKQADVYEKLHGFNETWESLQSIARGSATRMGVQYVKNRLTKQVPSIIGLQSNLRAVYLRQQIETMLKSLEKEESSILGLQSAIRGHLSRVRQETDMRALQQQEAVVIHLQALARAAILRINVGDLLAQLEDQTPEVIELQALARAMLVRLSVGEALSDLEAEEEIITELQAVIRGSLVRESFAEKQRFYMENMKKVIKIQSIARAKIQGEAYRSLTVGKNPPVNTIKGFVHLLNDSDFDFDEEIEFERLRKTVVQQVRQNEMADQYVTQLDIKIALLVKNKITLDEVVKHQKHFGGHVGSLLPNSDISSKDPFDLKALNKTSRRKLEHYQEFFFLLQTQPQYLARLFRRLREVATPEKECERIKHLIMGLFGYSQKRREEYYLIKLITKSCKEDMDAFTSVKDYVRCSFFWNRLFGAYAKSPKDRKFMRDILGQLVKENVIDNRELDLESDPMQIYRSAINNEELRTGKRSRRRPDVPREEAIRDPETRATFIAHLQDLRDIADQFFTAFEEFLHRMPFGVRFIAQQMYEHLISGFEHEDQGYILQVIGQWVWRSYLQPAVLEPEKFGVVDRGLTQEQKRNLGEVAKVLAQVASGRLFGGENVYLQPLNGYIEESIQRLGNIWGNMISVPDAESHFDIGEFNDLYAKTKPTLYIKMSDIFSIHQLVANEISTICPSQEDVLKDIIRDLGSVKSNESELMSVRSSEISLTLSPKLHDVEDPNANIKSLFMETKRCILYIIRVQSGPSLMEIMVKPVTEEDEERWNTLVHEELASSDGRRGAYSEANTAVDISSMSYTELKRSALENIVHLERAGRIARHNHYQDLLNEIAVDIRTKHRRRVQRHRELEAVRLTLDRLHDQAVYLEQQLKTYNDYIEQAMMTLQNKKGKKRFLMPFTKQWDHQRELQRTGRVFKFGSFKYSARNLADKGVLVHWKGYTERQWDRVDLTISSNEVGVFTIDGSSGNMMVPGANAQVPLDDLLQAQFNNTQFLDFFESTLRLNVNLFLHLIMRKFYNE